MNITKTTPIYVYEEIASAAQFWEQTLGFKKVVEVPHDGKPGFLLLANGDREVMFQSVASLQADVPAVAERVRPGGVVLYCNVDSIQDALKVVPSKNILVPLRKTFYGADEIFFQDSSGAIVGFSQHAEED